jgi:hypothetical protein
LIYGLKKFGYWEDGEEYFTVLFSTPDREIKMDEQEFIDSQNRALRGYLNEPPKVFLIAFTHLIRQETRRIQMLIELLSNPDVPDQERQKFSLQDGLINCDEIYKLLDWAREYISRLDKQDTSET